MTLGIAVGVLIIIATCALLDNRMKTQLFICTCGYKERRLHKYQPFGMSVKCKKCGQNMKVEE